MNMRPGAGRELRGLAGGLALAVGVAILATVVKFVAAQPTSILRNALFLHPVMVLGWLPLGIVPGVAYWYVARRRGVMWLFSALLFLALCVVLWNRVQYPPLCSWLLPPVSTK